MPKSQTNQRADKPSLLKKLADTRFTMWGVLGLFAIAAMLLLMVGNYHYLKKFEEQSLFLPTVDFVQQCSRYPGGVLRWLGCFATQFFYYPWLGALLETLCLTGLALLSVKAFKVPRRFTGYATISSIALLALLLNMGYLLFNIKSPGWPFSNVLGMAVAVAIFWGYRNCRNSLLRTAIIAVTVIVGYLLFGCFALIAALLCMVNDLTTRQRLWWLPMIVGIAAIVITPRVYLYSDYLLLHEDLMYVQGLPPTYSVEIVLRTIIAVYCLFPLVLAFMTDHWKQVAEKPQRGYLLATLVMLVALGYTTRLRNCADENLRQEIRMEQALEENDFQKVTEYAREQNCSPTRLICLFTDISLLRLGRSGDEMFTYPVAATIYHSTRPATAMRDVGGRMLDYLFGRINDSYRWCMEDMVEYGSKVEYLKQMVRCSLFNGETELARKYNNILAKTLFHRDWAKKYQRFIDDPKLIVKEPEFKDLAPLNAYNDNIGGDGGGYIETYLLYTLSNMAGGPPQLVELSLMTNLIQKNIDEFWPRFMLYARNNKRLPVHYQEAAILFSALEGKVDYRQFQIEPRVEERFKQFFTLAQRCAGNSDETNAEIFRDDFGNTYWYYYFFIKGLKTT